MCDKRHGGTANLSGMTLCQPTHEQSFSRTRLTDSSAVLFSEGVVDQAALTRRTRRLEVSETQSSRCTPDGEYRDVPQGRSPCRRRLQATLTPATATVTISSVQFNAYGSPSSAAEAGVTSITVTTTSDGEVRNNVPLFKAPVVRSKRAELSSTRTTD